MLVKELFHIELRVGEVVVSMTTLEDYVLVITDRGTVYKIVKDGRYYD